MLSYLAQQACVCLSACALLPATAVFPERHFVAAFVFGLAAATGVASDLGHAACEVLRHAWSVVFSYTHHMFKNEKVRSS